MASMILLFNHSLTEEQQEEAMKNWEVDNFISLPLELKNIWSNMPAQNKSIIELLNPIKDFVDSYVEDTKYVLIQGDFGATYIMIEYVKSIGLTPLYATSKRESTEEKIDGVILKKSKFRHERFRKYEIFKKQ